MRFFFLRLHHPLQAVPANDIRPGVGHSGLLAAFGTDQLAGAAGPPGATRDRAAHRSGASCSYHEQGRFPADLNLAPPF